jgi:EPS-associated MarR family transcriptional regulator
MLSDEARYSLLRLLEANPAMSQRDVARQLGMSLGKVNFCVQALVEKGMLKATNFKNSQRKAAYMYFLTPRGIEEKAQVTARFLQTKVQEYEELRADIARIREEVKRNSRRQRRSGGTGKCLERGGAEPARRATNTDER